MSAELDHLVINTRFDTDAAAELFAALGFTLTPRGYHSLGSINHLIVFEQGYLELIGLPSGTDRLRQEVLESPVGIDGLVLACDDPIATHERLVRQGFAAQPVQRFSRPVEVDGVEQEARFATVRLPGEFAAGRVYFCHHETPELVWRREWLGHANGVSGIARLTVVSAEPEESARRYARLGGFDGDFQLDIVDAQALVARFGVLAWMGVQPPERFAAISLRCADPSLLAQRASALGLAHGPTPAGVVVSIPAFATLLEFVQ
ncbi:VOC family protein [Halotalea alkalilenta]|uniref:Glyoxalase-like domain-containing protein n=1 Tax=Halotalea alkalilenta TaxID=376489 RepID=A0A172YGB8_9GAMM|nr:VOC family protein [Halotalea alkalilenta]ANF58308.1 hypothetical protein A5892_13190 [Halotalea alkalilenta]